MPPSKRPDPVDQDLIQALAHPLRVKILELLQGQVSSATKLARALDTPIGVIAYHVKVLRECGSVELTKQEPRRGATENFYTGRPKAFIGHPEWKNVPEIARGGTSAAALRTFNRKAVAAIEADAGGANGETCGWMAIRLDEAGRKEAGQILADAIARLEQVHERAAARLGEERRDGEPFIVGVAGFADVSAAPGEN